MTQDDGICSPMAMEWFPGFLPRKHRGLHRRLVTIVIFVLYNRNVSQGESGSVAYCALELSSSYCALELSSSECFKKGSFTKVFHQSEIMFSNWE